MRKKLITKPVEQEASKNLLANGVPTIKDLMAPPSFDRSKEDYIKVGNKFARSFLVSGYPKQIQVGWADSIYNYEGDMDIALHIVPADERQALDELTDKITQAQAQLSTELERGSNRELTRLQAQIQDLINERAKIEQNYISMFRVQMAMNMFANSADQLNKETQLLDSSLRGRKIQLMPAYLQMDKCYKSALPFGKTWLPKNYRNFSSESLTACFPFYTAEISHKSGTYLGVNLQTSTPIYIDFFNRSLLNSGNTTVFGTSGSGKSFLVSLMTMRSAIEGIRTVIIDPEGEYNDVAEAVGGATVVIAPGSELIMNPFDLEVTEDAETGEKSLEINNKVSDMLNLIGVMAGGLTPEQESLISFVLSDLYADFGFTTDPESLYMDGAVLEGDTFEHKAKKLMPTFSDFYVRLSKFAQEKGNDTLVPVANTLRMFTKDGVYGMFDRQTAPELANLNHMPVVNFDVSKLEENILRPIGMYIALNWTWEMFIKKNPYIKKRVVCDEAWMLMNRNMAGHEYTAKALETMARRIRKQRGALMVASQNFREFADNPQGQAILTNTAVNIFLRQNETDAPEVQKMFRLSDGERDFLTRAPKGNFLLKIGNESTVGQAVPFEYEHYIITKSKPETRQTA